MPQIQKRIGNAIQGIPEHASGEDHFADNLSRIIRKIFIDDGASLPAVLCIFGNDGRGLHPILILFFAGIFPEENYIRGDISKRVLPEGGFRLAVIERLAEHGVGRYLGILASWRWCGHGFFSTFRHGHLLRWQ